MRPEAPARSRPTGEVPAGAARSWLLLSALRLSELPGAAGVPDQIILDIEDAVDPTRKPAAREDVASLLSGAGDAWVRINDAASAFWEDDVDALRGLPGLRGVMLAKVEDGTQVTRTFDRLGGTTPVIALVESALGIEMSVDIARARGTFRLAFGSGDYRRDTGASAADLAMAYPRSRLVVASRVGSLPGPIDGPTVGGGESALRQQSGLASDLGMTGKLCLTTDAVGTVNEAFAPAPSEVAWARRFLAEFHDGGRIIRDGSDLPRLGRAEKVDRLAEVFGIQPSSDAGADASRLGY
jgi:citrate lyase subunit beta/citryl-CoA lyase